MFGLRLLQKQYLMTRFYGTMMHNQPQMPILYTSSVIDGLDNDEMITKGRNNRQPKKVSNYRLITKQYVKYRQIMVNVHVLV